MSPSTAYENNFNLELRTYEKIFAGVCGFGVRCLPIDEGDELGYTSSDKTIHLAYHHEIMSGMFPDKKTAFRQGVFVHEMLHQIFTDFNAEDTFLAENGICLNYTERRIFHDIVNILEDSAIEYFAPQEIGSRLLKSLRFMIAWVWRKSQPIEKTKDPFGQFLNAFIQVGDIGVIKGHFTDETAKAAYEKALPVFSAGIIEPQPILRVKYAYEIFEISKLLWQDRVSEAEELIKMLDEILQAACKENAVSIGDDSAFIIPDSCPSDEAGEKKQRTRGSSVSGSDSGNDSDDEIQGNSNEQDPAKEYDLSNEDVDEITAEIAKEEKTQEKEKKEKESEKDDSPLPSFDVRGNFKNASSVNERASQRSCSETEYDQVVSEYRTTINACTKYLKDLFRDSAEDTIRHTSGKYNILRAQTSESARIFDKRRVPADRKPAVLMLIDKSGSTNGKKILTERNTAIILSEVFGKLGIPFYVMAFFAFGDTAYHEHFITWKNNRTTRMSLTGLRSDGCNFDGYSIRYAGKILEKRPESRKIMFILSDGIPSCNAYRSREDGILDTANAIREVRKKCNVCGFGVGAGLEQMQQMYGNGFITVEQLDMLAPVLIKKMKQIL